MSKAKGKTLADLAAAHDKTVIIPNRIRQALTALAASGEEWAYEADFRQLSSPPLSHNELPKFRSEFPNSWAEMPRTGNKSAVPIVWFATEELCKTWRKREQKTK